MAARECPRDWTELDEETLEVLGPDVTVDACPECDGMFLDRHELLRLTADPDVFELLETDLGLDSDSDLLCPRCGGIMDAEHVPLASGDPVEADVCLDCRGVWLDAGELERIQAGDVDMDDLPDSKRAELFDAHEAKKAEARRNSLLARFARLLRGRRR